LRLTFSFQVSQSANELHPAAAANDRADHSIAAPDRGNQQGPSQGRSWSRGFPSVLVLVGSLVALVADRSGRVVTVNFVKGE